MTSSTAASMPAPRAKRCPRCGSDGPFWRHLGNPDGLQYYCVSCQTAYHRRWAAANRARHLAATAQDGAV